PFANGFALGGQARNADKLGPRGRRKKEKGPHGYIRLLFAYSKPGLRRLSRHRREKGKDDPRDHVAPGLRYTSFLLCLTPTHPHRNSTHVRPSGSINAHLRAHSIGPIFIGKLVCAV